eukprot:scaffold65578_cov66-Phaeocystis_antarctica.AAC.1
MPGETSVGSAAPRTRSIDVASLRSRASIVSPATRSTNVSSGRDGSLAPCRAVIASTCESRGEHDTRGLQSSSSGPSW